MVTNWHFMSSPVPEDSFPKAKRGLQDKRVHLSLALGATGGGCLTCTARQAPCPCSPGHPVPPGYSRWFQSSSRDPPRRNSLRRTFWGGAFYLQDNQPHSSPQNLLLLITPEQCCPLPHRPVLFTLARARSSSCKMPLVSDLMSSSASTWKSGVGLGALWSLIFPSVAIPCHMPSPLPTLSSLAGGSLMAASSQDGRQKHHHGHPENSPKPRVMQAL